jgi:hypothetical protein
MNNEMIDDLEDDLKDDDDLKWQNDKEIEICNTSFECHKAWDIDTTHEFLPGTLKECFKEFIKLFSEIGVNKYGDFKVRQDHIELKLIKTKYIVDIIKDIGFEYHLLIGVNNFHRIGKRELLKLLWFMVDIDTRIESEGVGIDLLDENNKVLIIRLALIDTDLANTLIEIGEQRPNRT